MHVVNVDSSGQRKNKSCIFLCVCTQERHHRVIRRAVVNRLNKTSLEQGLAEDLAVESIRQLRLEPLRNGFVKPHPPTASMLHSLTQHLGCSGQNVTTCVAARSGAVTLHRGDCAIYTFDRINMLAGDILFSRHRANGVSAPFSARGCAPMCSLMHRWGAGSLMCLTTSFAFQLAT